MNEHDQLNEAVKALKHCDVPEGPPPQTVDETLAELQNAVDQTRLTVPSSSNVRSGGYGMMGGSSGYGMMSSPGRGRSTGRTGIRANLFLPGSGQSLESGTLVVPAPSAGPEDILKLQDDLQVMSRLLAKQMEQAGITPPGDNASLVTYDMMMAGP